MSPRVFIARFDLERRVEACAALAVVIEMHLWAAHFKVSTVNSTVVGTAALGQLSMHTMCAGLINNLARCTTELLKLPAHVSMRIHRVTIHVIAPVIF